MLRKREVCERFGIHDTTFYRWIHSGLLPAIRLPSGEYRVSEEDVDEILLHGQLTAKKKKARKVVAGSSLLKPMMSEYLRQMTEKAGKEGDQCGT